MEVPDDVAVLGVHEDASSQRELCRTRVPVRVRSERVRSRHEHPVVPMHVALTPLRSAPAIGAVRVAGRRARAAAFDHHGQRGQALIIAIFALAIAATAVLGLRAAQTRLLIGAGDESAGEAAVEAAASVYADASASFGRGGSSRAGWIDDAGVLDAARSAAIEAARANGRDVVVEPRAAVHGGVIEVELTLEGRRYRADVPVTCCPR